MSETALRRRCAGSGDAIALQIPIERFFICRFKLPSGPTRLLTRIDLLRMWLRVSAAWRCAMAFSSRVIALSFSHAEDRNEHETEGFVSCDSPDCRAVPRDSCV